MKKVFSLMLVAGIFALGACGPSDEEAAAAQEEAEDAVNAIFDNLEDAVEEAAEEVEEAGDALAEHVCNEDCTEDGCAFKHGEEGHECGDECANMDGEDGDEG